MAEAKSVPVLFVTDTIVLPGMVVPIALGRRRAGRYRRRAGQ